MNVRNFILELQKQDPELEVVWVDQEWGLVVVDDMEVTTESAHLCLPKQFLVLTGDSGPDFEADPEAQAKAEADFRAREEARKDGFKKWIKKNEGLGI
jgi:hypothetical protein